MPKTMAVRKAKEMMAASILSLILSSIVASFAGTSRLSGAERTAPHFGESTYASAGCQAEFDAAER
jgi:hypothetical protein